MQSPCLRGYILADPDSRHLELRTPADVGWTVTRYSDGALLEAGPATLDVTAIFDQLDALDQP